MKINLIFLSGKKGSGKDTAALILEQNIEGWVEVQSFAEALKSTVYNLYKHRITWDSIYGTQEQKEADIPGFVMPEEAQRSMGVSRTYWSGRLLLQYMGTDLLRNAIGCDNLWSEKVSHYIDETINNEKYLDEHITIVLSDARFDTEISTLLGNKGWDIGVVRVLDIKGPGNSRDWHSSESGLSPLKITHTIDNIERTHKALQTNLQEVIDEVNEANNRLH